MNALVCVSGQHTWHRQVTIVTATRKGLIRGIDSRYKILCSHSFLYAQYLGTF